MQALKVELPPDSPYAPQNVGEISTRTGEMSFEPFLQLPADKLSPSFQELHKDLVEDAKRVEKFGGFFKPSS